MKKLVVLTFLILSCSSGAKEAKSNKSELTEQNVNILDEVDSGYLNPELKTVLSEFSLVELQALDFTIDTNWQAMGNDTGNCLSVETLQLFPNALTEVSKEKSTLIPVSISKLKGSMFLLSAAQPHDLGVTLHATVVDSSNMKLVNSYVVASVFGDAETSEESKSELDIEKGLVKKTTVTRIAEINWDAEPIEVLGDSVYVNDTVYYLYR